MRFAASSTAMPSALGKGRWYDASGRLVRLVANERRAGGTHRFTLGGGNARELPAGLYFYRVETPTGSAHGPVIVLE